MAAANNGWTGDEGMRWDNIFRRRSKLSLKLLLGLLAAGLILAAASAVRAQNLGDVLPVDCALAEATIAKRLQPTAERGPRLVPALKDEIIGLQGKARALCLDSQPERAMVIYFRISDVVGGALAQQLDGERRRR
jgi:hypothetical protein